MPSFTNTFGGTNVYSANPSYRAIALTANVTLTWPTELATDTNVVASIMDVTPSGAGFTIRMPDASQASVGETALFFNVGASSFTVADNGGNTIQTITTGEAWQIYLTGNATANGTWRSIEYGAGTSSPSASALAGAGLKAITTTLNQAAPTTLLSVNYTLTSLDRARVLVWNGGAGTFTMPSAASAGNDWFFDARNSGSGGLTIAPAGGELINGQASLVFNPGDSARILTDGANFYTIGYGQSATFAFDYVSISLTGQPSPYTLSGTNLNRIAYQFSGILTANMQIVVPNTIQQYWIRNTTTGAYSLTVKTAAGTGIAVVQNGAAILYCDGTNVVEADTNNLSTPIGIAQGGTGATTAGNALINLGGTSLGIGIFTATNPASARAAIGAAGAGANADITSLSGLTTPLSIAQGGTGQTTFSPGVGIAYSTGSAWGASYTTSGTGTTLALSASPALTGTPTAPTAALGTNTTQLATTAFVVSTSFSSALPGQTGNAGKFITTNGVSASWDFVPLATSVTGTLAIANGGTSSTTAAAALVALGAAANVNIQEFSTPGTSTWTKPANAKLVYVLMFGAGGGGGGGRRRAAANQATEACYGGGGGGAGGRSEAFLPATALGATVSVVVATGATGGAGATADSTNGTGGSDGGDSSFGSIVARGGLGGNGGTTTSAFGGNGGTCVPGEIYTQASNYGAGGANATNTNPGAPGGRGGLRPGGGGSASGFLAAATGGRAGGDGGRGGDALATSGVRPPSDSGGGGAGGSSSGGNGVAGSNAVSIFVGGSGGGAGGSNTTTSTLGNGGAGGSPGGGGGGGSPGSGFNGGSGGAGGNGYVVVITFF